MMITVTLVLGIIILILAVRLYLYRRQVKEFSRQLMELKEGSNQRLTCFLHTPAVTQLGREINRCIDLNQEAVLKSREAEQELKYTIACVSHDIRTPLTGAAGYVQLLEQTEEKEKKSAYCRIVRGRLKDLEQLLDELFLYTRLAGGEVELHCQSCQLLPVLSECLMGGYEKLTEKNMEPSLDFSQENIQVTADVQQLKRVLGNLISNAAAHGKGTLFIAQEGKKLTFSNQVEDPSQIDPNRMFERFYRADNARRGSHAGLGLSIARELMERMGGKLYARLEEDMLKITVEFL